MTTRTSRLLIVDDNELNRDMLARRLERKGYEVVLAAGAHQLMERISEGNIDIVLLDIEMPEISGLDALKTVRETYSQVELPSLWLPERIKARKSAEGFALGAMTNATNRCTLSFS